jgi:hypothetical protein
MSLKEDYEKAQALTIEAKAELDQAEAVYDAKWYEHPIIDYPKHAKELKRLSSDCYFKTRKVIDAERMEANLKDRLTWECLRSKSNAAAQWRKR